MTEPLTSEKQRELILAYLAGAADESDQAQAQRLIDSDSPTVAGYVAEAQALLGQVPLTLEPVQPSEELEEQLMRQVHGQAPLRLHAPIDPPAQPDNTKDSNASRTWLLAAVSGLVAAVLAVAVTSFVIRDILEDRADTRMVAIESRLQEQIDTLNRTQAEAQELQTQVNQQDDLIQQLRRKAGDQEALMASLRSPRLQIIHLVAENMESGSAIARMLWDASHRRCYFYASGLSAPESGKTYQLWCVTPDERKVSVGTFDVGEDGSATFMTDLPSDIEKVTLAAVTDEPTGGSKEPTGKYFLRGKF